MRGGVIPAVYSWRGERVLLRSIERLMKICELGHVLCVCSLCVVFQVVMHSDSVRLAWPHTHLLVLLRSFAPQPRDEPH